MRGAFVVAAEAAALIFIVCGAFALPHILVSLLHGAMR